MKGNNLRLHEFHTIEFLSSVQIPPNRSIMPLKLYQRDIHVPIAAGREIHHNLRCVRFKFNVYKIKVGGGGVRGVSRL